MFDPQGGYFKSGGKFVPSLVAEIGWAIEDHLQKIGLLQKTEVPEHQQKILDEKRAEFEGKALDLKPQVNFQPMPRYVGSAVSKQ